MKRKSDTLDAHHTSSLIVHRIEDSKGNECLFSISNFHPENADEKGIFVNIISDSIFPEGEISEVIEWLTKSLESIADVHREEYEKS